MAEFWTLRRIADILGAELCGDGGVTPASLSMDTRTLEPSACFVAIRAERDGHAFAAQAVQKGACALLVDHVLDLDCPQLLVPDTLAALQRWGQARLEACRPRAVFGVTGSVGKTSTKDLLAAATGGWKTPGNRNNTLGLPEALATLPAALDVAVLEMGMSTPGEIRRLTEIAPLDFGLVTHIGTAHLENFQDGQAGIARAKGELVAGIRPGGAWAHHADDPWCAWIAEQSWAAHAMACPVGEGQAFQIGLIRSLGAQGEAFPLITPAGPMDVHIKLRGVHQVRNAALAAVIALLANVSPDRVIQGLASVEPEAGRGRLHGLRAGGWLLDESYNASPDSVLACANALLALKGGEPCAILGCMRELGPESARFHEETGRKLHAMGISRLWAFGDQADHLAAGFGDGAHAFPSYEALQEAPSGLTALPSGARILVKGSRFWQSERAVHWILEHASHQP